MDTEKTIRGQAIDENTVRTSSGEQFNPGISLKGYEGEQIVIRENNGTQQITRRLDS